MVSRYFHHRMYYPIWLKDMFLSGLWEPMKQRLSCAMSHVMTKTIQHRSIKKKKNLMLGLQTKRIRVRRRSRGYQLMSNHFLPWSILAWEAQNPVPEHKQGGKATPPKHVGKNTKQPQNETCEFCLCRSRCLHILHGLVCLHIWLPWPFS